MVQMNEEDMKELKLILFAVLGIGIGYYFGSSIGYGTEVLFMPLGLIYAVKLVNNQNE